MDKISNYDKSQILIDALPYIQKYNNKILVIKYGGNAMTNDELKDAVMNDIVLLSLVGIKVVLVHGGGPEINDMLKRLGIESRFVNGLRYTDDTTIDVVKMVLSGKVNKELVQLLAQQPAVAVETLLLKRVQVNDELHVQSVPDVGQRKRLFAALVVHDAQIQPPVTDIAVYTVHLAGKRDRHAVLLTGDGRQVAAAREIHLVVDRTELRHAQLLDDVVQDLLHALDQPPEQIAEARRLVCQTANLLPDVLVDRLATRTRDRVLPCGGSAAARTGSPPWRWWGTPTPGYPPC